MADLTDIQAAQSVKLVGSGASGLEGTPVTSTSSGSLFVNLRDNAGTESGTPTNPLSTSNIMNGGGVNGAITVSTTAVGAHVGIANLTNRKNLTVWNNGSGFIYWGYDNTVTASSGTPLMRNQQLTGDWGPSTTIWLIAGSGSEDVRITEGA